MANVFIFLTVVLFGVGAFLGKFALKNAAPLYVYMFEALGTLTVAATAAFVFRKEASEALHNFSAWGYVFGILFGLGTVTFIMALKLKPASLVVPLTALYPLVTVVLSMLVLNETITLKSALGIVFAVIAVILLA